MLFQPWGLLLLSGLAALAAIYFLQRRFRRRQVSSLMLWRLPRLPQQGGRNWRRLRTPPPFWLELLLILLLALAAAAPHFKLHESRRPLAVVLDDSFSMLAGSAAPGEGSESDATSPQSPRDLAAEALLEELEGGRHAPVHLVLAGQEASLLAQDLRGEEPVMEALQGWRCHAPSADLTSAVALARRLAGDLGRVLVLSDQPPGEELSRVEPGSSAEGGGSSAGNSSPASDMELPTEAADGETAAGSGAAGAGATGAGAALPGSAQETRAGASQYVQWSFGRPRANLALINAGRSSASSRTFVEIANLGDSAVRTTLTIETLPTADALDSAQNAASAADPAAASAATGSGTMGGGSADGNSARNQDGESASVGVRPQDSPPGASQRTLDLAAGETRRLVLEADRRRPIRLSLPVDALQSDNQVLLLPEERPPVRAAVEIEDPALDRLLQRTLQATGQARIVEERPEMVFLTSRDAPQDTLDPARPWRFRLLSESGARPQAGPFVVDRAHPLGQGLSLSAVLWAASPGPLPGNPVILADEIPLLSVRPALDGRVDMWMRLHPPASNVQRTADWPILIYNLLSWRQDRRPGPLRSNLRSGEQVRIRLEEASPVSLRLPDGTQRSLSPTAGEVSLSALQPGLYRVESADGDRYHFSANVLHPGESELRRAATGRWGQWIDQAARRWEYADLTWIPLLAALLVLLLHQLLTGGYLSRTVRQGGLS